MGFVVLLSGSLRLLSLYRIVYTVTAENREAFREAASGQTWETGRVRCVYCWSLAGVDHNEGDPT